MVIKNEELLRQYAPAAFAKEPENGRVSDRYSFLPTTDILNILGDCGWSPWKASQVNARKWSKGHAKHIIRLRHEELTPQAYGVGDSFPAMLLINSHNGLGCYELRGGIFRMVCSNGMVISEAEFDAIKIRHIGFEEQQVVNASKEFVNGAGRWAEQVLTWQNTELDKPTRRKFFTDAAHVRFEAPDDLIIRDISTPHRTEDQGTDLWTLFNITQDNVMRGGFVNTSTGRKARPIKNILKDINYSSQLWSIADKYSREVSLN